MLCLTSQDGCEVYCSDMKTHYKCDSNSKCLLNSTICDGKPDCLDGTDERNCEGIYTYTSYLWPLKLLRLINDIFKKSSSHESIPPTQTSQFSLIIEK